MFSPTYIEEAQHFETQILNPGTFLSFRTLLG
jgi:hypothetical protein